MDDYHTMLMGCETLPLVAREIKVFRGLEDAAPRRYTVVAEIVEAYEADPALSDGDAALARELIEVQPDGDLRHRCLAQRLQTTMRLHLSLDDYRATNCGRHSARSGNPRRDTLASMAAAGIWTSAEGCVGVNARGSLAPR